MDKKEMIKITTEDDITIVSFCTASIGGVSGVEEIGRELREYVSANQPKKVIVDFGGVKFFSSQILGLLVDLWRRLRDHDGIVCISRLNPQLNRVFKITNLERLFKFYPDKEIAIKAISAEGS